MVTINEWENYKKMIIKNRRYSFWHGKKKMVEKIYLDVTGDNLDFNNCKKYREKLQQIKLSKNPLMSICADKDAVREYVKNKIGSKYLVKQYFCKSKISEEDLNELPSSFVLKTTSGSSTNIVVKDKSKENLKELVDVMNYYKDIKYGYLWGEFFYNKIKTKIIAEKLLTTDDIDDYKIHCFRNKGKLIQIIEVIYNTPKGRFKNMYDSNWKKLNYSFSLESTQSKKEKPKCLSKLLELSSKLSEDFNYARIDFYIVNNKIYFGEITFVPTAGYGHFKPEKYDEIWGSYIGEEI